MWGVWGGVWQREEVKCPSLSMHWTGSEMWIWGQAVQLMWRLCGCKPCFRDEYVERVSGKCCFYKEIRKRLFLNMCPKSLCSLYFALLGLECAFPVGSFFFFYFFFLQILEKKLSFCCSLILKESSLSILACISIKNVDIYLASKRNIPKHLWVYASLQ